MKSKIIATIAIAAIFLMIVTACRAGAAQTEEFGLNNEPPEGDIAEMPAVEPAAPPLAPEPESAQKIAGDDVSSATGTTLSMDLMAASYRTERMIIKNAEVRLLVEDTDVAIDRAIQVVGDVQGYVISQRVWYQDWLGESYKYTTITMGVPVNQFERALRRLRDISLKVLDENASGQDVTDQFVDLESQLGNLEATRDRIRTFLEQAKTVDEALRVNQELAEVEGQIEEIKGRMNYLSDRSAFSTITVNMEPELPEPPTPTPTPTFTPTPTPAPWSLKPAIDNATETLTVSYQGIMEFLVWVGLVFVPIFGPFILGGWLLFRFVRRKASPPAPPPSKES